MRWSDMGRIGGIKAAWVLVLLVLCSASSVFATEMKGALPPGFRERILAQFARRVPHQWAERVKGVRTRLKTGDRVVALTLDACGSRKGMGFDEELIGFLEKEGVPATLFLNARWIDANPLAFRRLSANPLFEIANHGLLHRPASISGRSAYGIAGTGTVQELFEEIEGNAEKIAGMIGVRPRYYRSGTAFYDEVAVEISRSLGEEVIGFSILGDAGATYSADQVRQALVQAKPGDIAIMHMNHPEGGTAAGVISAVPELRRRGFRFVRLSEYELE